MNVLELAVPVKMWQRFDYLPPIHGFHDHAWLPGSRVQVPFGKRTLTAILMRIKEQSEIPKEQLKHALELLDEQPLLTSGILALCEWASEYYHYPIGEVVAQVLPKGLRQGRVIQAISDIPVTPPLNSVTVALNPDQKKAVETILAAKDHFQTYLLEGVTGSGKTEVYFHSISELVHTGRQVLFLVPEIALTPQTQERFQKRFNVPTVLLHSDLTDKKRLDGWLKAAKG
ncbi:MAG: DEAD/DEAH box helicase family protein, partial [Proteobacteria bacterium]|nr:DEAD/DEAH box helicase family protein [Pseudomonadota bacterium]